MEQNKLQYVEQLEEYKEDMEKLGIIFETVNEGLFYMNMNYHGRFFNNNFYQKFDIVTDQICFKDWLRLVHPDDKKMYEEFIERQILNKSENYKIQYRVKNKLDKFVWIESNGKVVYDERNAIHFMVGSHLDITDRKMYEERIFYLAYHDEITGLYNVNKIKEILEWEISSQNRGYLIYIDISNFRVINDMMNYQIGNDILKITGERLSNILPKQSFLARNYGGEFCVIVKETDIDSIDIFSQALLEVIKQPINLKTRIIQIDARIGIINFPKNEFDSENIIFNSQMIISMMKDKNIVGVSFYDEKLQKTHLRKLSIERCLCNALINKEMYLNYQPIIELETGKIHGFEALLRWENQELGKIFPDEFISIAEKNSYINDIGDFVLYEACQFGNKLRELNIFAHISVNVSVVQLYRSDYVSRVLSIIENTGFDRCLLYLEITESTALDSNPSVIDRLKSLCDEGIKISIDDFGKGYSSMNSITALPVSQLKIDRSLVNNVKEGKDTIGLIELMVSHGKKSGYNVLAEGIEDEMLANKICDINVAYGQGYHFFKPMLSEDVFSLVSDRKNVFLDSK